MTSLFEQVSKTIGKLADTAYSKNWMMYAIIIIVGLIVIVILKS